MREMRSYCRCALQAVHYFKENWIIQSGDDNHFAKTLTPQLSLVVTYG
jgi:hypothetical protein